MPKQVMESSSLEELKNCVDVTFEEWFSGERGIGEMMVGHDDLKGLFQLQQFFDSVAIHILCFGCMVGWPQWGKDVEEKG